MTVVPGCVLLGLALVPLPPIICFGSQACRVQGGCWAGVCTGCQSAARGQRGAFVSASKGKTIPGLALSPCLWIYLWAELASLRALPPKFGEGCSEGPLVMHFMLRLVNEMRQSRSVGGVLSISKGCVRQHQRRWQKGLSQVTVFLSKARAGGGSEQLE